MAQTRRRQHMKMSLGDFYMKENKEITVGNSHPVSIRELVAVARAGWRVRIHPDVIGRLEQARQIVDRYNCDSAPPVYGITTGLGSLKEVRIPSEGLRAYNLAVIRDHATAVGDIADTELVRATVFARIVGLAQGGSGISPATFAGLVALLNAHVTPEVRLLGSVGEADLGVLRADVLRQRGYLEETVGARSLLTDSRTTRICCAIQVAVCPRQPTRIARVRRTDF